MKFSEYILNEKALGARSLNEASLKEMVIKLSIFSESLRVIIRDNNLSSREEKDLWKCIQAIETIISNGDEDEIADLYNQTVKTCQKIEKNYGNSIHEGIVFESVDGVSLNEDALSNTVFILGVAKASAAIGALSKVHPALGGTAAIAMLGVLGAGFLNSTDAGEHIVNKSKGLFSRVSGAAKSIVDKAKGFAKRLARD